MREEARAKDLLIYPSGPLPGMVYASRRKLCLQTWGGDQDGTGRRVKAAYHGPKSLRRKSGSNRKIIWKARVKGRGERNIVRHAPPARAPANWPFSGNMNNVWRKVSQSLSNAKPGHQGQTNFIITGTRNIGELVRGDDVDLMPKSPQLGNSFRQGPHDAINLRRPCVCRQCNPHAATALALLF